MTKMSDVARLANVSTATVSRVLRNPEAVTEPTKHKVLEAIEELNYQPNMLARHFRRTETNTILVVVPNIINTVFAEIVGGIEDEASKKGYRVLLRNSNNQIDSEYGSIEHMKQRQVDGMIMLSPKLDEETLLDISNQYPIVLATAHLDGVKIPVVSIDNINSSKKATEHLISLGHKRIAHLTGPLYSLISKNRCKGYRRAMIENGLEIYSNLILEGDFTYESGYKQMKKLLDLENPPTAVFAASDDMAMGVVNAAKHHGLNVPGDLAVVGFDNIKFSSIFDPPLTTIAQPMFGMGKRAMELLIRKFKGESLSQTEHVLPDKLIIRESCGTKQKESTVV
ncbi:LacI family transcriptional regulator [Halobacillus shinanisalinarum]|uniref:LacI family transcriptional regulator n=1 Tax=Halobacillus shinanisalinarum TaxID=2932258 RepID=A0ABY4GZG5_9BACI|nr:LacI family DNA-binding transcriptional regulator [Halobacillus shinanisalinarum]UOQ93303.1 LacI family transcriptional regulator [Halobacillus shinanisalinarum]